MSERPSTAVETISGASVNPSTAVETISGASVRLSTAVETSPITPLTEKDLKRTLTAEDFTPQTGGKVKELFPITKQPRFFRRKYQHVIPPAVNNKAPPRQGTASTAVKKGETPAGTSPHFVVSVVYSSMEPLTMPRRDVLMKLSIKSLSSQGSYSVSMARRASELFSPRV